MSEVRKIAGKILANKRVVTWNQTYWIYDGKSYRGINEDELKYHVLHHFENFGIEPTMSMLNKVILQMGCLTFKQLENLSMPSWLNGGKGCATQMVNLDNGLYDIKSGMLHEHTSDFFCTGHLPYAYDPEAKCPQWLAFLSSSLVEEDQIALAQTWMGYQLVFDNRYQKWMLLKGPTGAGKGVYMSVLEALLGRNNITSTTLQQMAEPFGLGNLIGKRAALVGETEVNHWGNDLVQNIKLITGGDTVYINRKFMPVFTQRLPVRFTVACNRTPSLPDASNALAARMLVLNFPNSFRNTDKQKIHLAADIVDQEMPGVFNWALAGLKKLTKDGLFVQSALGQDVITDFQEAASPAKCFFEAFCVEDPHAAVPTSDLYFLWKLYAHEMGHQQTSQKKFVINLKAAFCKLENARHLPGDKRGLSGCALNQHGQSVLKKHRLVQDQFTIGGL